MTQFKKFEGAVSTETVDVMNNKEDLVDQILATWTMVLIKQENGDITFHFTREPAEEAVVVEKTTAYRLLEMSVSNDPTVRTMFQNIIDHIWLKAHERNR